MVATGDSDSDDDDGLNYKTEAEKRVEEYEEGQNLPSTSNQCRAWQDNTQGVNI